ncbi:MAG: metallophosphoesterase family protein [Eubacteriales bacterium]|nr:metallophosphoesterase family protein [Eubacteriales bacterium]
MSCHTRISRAFEGALRLPLAEESGYILFSDCHRGCGNANDNFLKNEYLYLAALSYYFDRGFTCIELGDGDELWENRSMKCIREMHGRCFELLEKYEKSGRMYSIYGNHDLVKKYPGFQKKYFPNQKFYSGIILEDQKNKKDIYLTHGHQSDFFNSALWRLSRFLVRYVWKPLEGLGIPDPTSAAKNNVRKKKSEAILSSWAKENGHILIGGHTHHPMLGSGESPYFNTGSCIHPSGITGIEIRNRCMTLVKWSMSAREDRTLYVRRESMGETVCIDDY